MPARGELVSIPDVGQLGTHLARPVCPPHFHDTYAISIFHAPSVIHCRGRRWMVGPGAVVILEPREVHWGEPALDGCPQAGFLPSPSLLAALFGRDEPCRLATPVVEHPALVAAVLDAIDRACAGESLSPAPAG